ncbi:hypothetical protein ACA910_005900 [Epithemia clementina (nom. ined.)]
MERSNQGNNKKRPTQPPPQQQQNPQQQQQAAAHLQSARSNAAAATAAAGIDLLSSSSSLPRDDQGLFSIRRFGGRAQGGMARRQQQVHAARPPQQQQQPPPPVPLPEPGEEASPLLSSLLEHLVELAHQAGFAEELIEVSKARLLLEATAGQIPLAAQLYWDDVLARTQHQQLQEQLQEQQQNHSAGVAVPAAAMAHHRPAAAAAAAASVAAAAGAVAPPVKAEHSTAGRPRSLRRRLESDYDLLQQRHKHSSINSNNAPPAAPAQPTVKNRYSNSGGSNPFRALAGLPARERREMPAHEEPYGPVRFDPVTGRATLAPPSEIARRGREMDAEFRLERERLTEEELRDLEQASRQEKAARDGLDDAFNDPEDDDDDDDDNDDDDDQEARANGAGGEADNNEHPIEEEGEEGPQPRLVMARGMEASVSVSDDEAAAEILRTVSAVQKSLRQKPPRGRKRPSSSADGLFSSPSKRSRTKDEYIGFNDDMEANGYLSDNDWIWESISSTARESIPPVAPMDFLWGVPASPVISLDDDDDGDTDANDDGSGFEKPMEHIKQVSGSSSFDNNEIDVKISDVVIVGMNEHPVRTVSRGKSGSDEASEMDKTQPPSHEHEKQRKRPPQQMDDASTGNDGYDRDNMSPSAADEEEEDGEDGKGGTIPVTWLRAGFRIANDEKMGLSCNAPNEDDIAYLQWKQQMPLSSAHSSSRRRGGEKPRLPQPPYHCPSITLLPAVVTALMQAGVTVVQETNASAPRVTSQTTRKPYFQLDAQTRAREWEPRLVDALTALLVIAAQSSKQRKAKALERAQCVEKWHQQQERRARAAAEDPLVKRAAAAPTSLSSIDSRTKSGKKKHDTAPAASVKIAGKSRNNSIQHVQSANSLSKNGDVSAASAKWQKLQSKLQLCPTCWWDKVDPNSNTINPPQANNHGYVLPNSDSAFSIPLSFTHICDLRSYVKSNLDAFLGTGGCALFLETILRIHGKGAVQRLVQFARQDESSKNKKNQSLRNKKLPPLVQCKCQERYHKAQQRQRISSWPGASKTAKDQTTFALEPCNDCASVELVSLLLTGRVFCTWKGWSTNMTPFANLGIGILTDRPRQVGRGLTRPLKPVWIVKGPSQYSVMWLNERNSAGILDESEGLVANMTHWSCWYGNPDNDEDSGDGAIPSHNSLTNVRFMTSTEPKSLEVGQKSKRAEPNALSSKFAAAQSPEADNNFDFDGQFTGTTVALLDERRRKEKQAVVDRGAAEYIEDDHLFTQSDLDRVRVHPDDAIYYESFRLWRYDILPRQTENNDDEGAKKARGDHWTPFHRLGAYDKMLVETKLGPKLAVILRTRWPGARIDRMEPSKPPPLV